MVLCWLRLWKGLQFASSKLFSQLNVCLTAGKENMHTAAVVQGHVHFQWLGLIDTYFHRKGYCWLSPQPASPAGSLLLTSPIVPLKGFLPSAFSFHERAGGEEGKGALLMKLHAENNKGHSLSRIWQVPENPSPGEVLGSGEKVGVEDKSVSAYC